MRLTAFFARKMKKEVDHKNFGMWGGSHFCFSFVFCDMENLLFFSLEEGLQWGPTLGASLYSSNVSYKVKQILVILT